MDFTWDVTVATSPQQTDPPRADTPPPPTGYRKNRNAIRTAISTVRNVLGGRVEFCKTGVSVPIARGVDLQLVGGGLTMVSRLCTNASHNLDHDGFCQVLSKRVCTMVQQ